ncbi:F-box only protein 33-like [Lineus longissimus]|uniref:F-box only protein 33-like n=1 Tax=Lineus longissimus TaxID=88925 RepID=UPI00315D2E3A
MLRKQKLVKMAADTSWSTLPSLIIVEILSYLSLKDRLNAVSTCKRWRSCFWHPSLWTNLVFRLKNGSRSRSKYLAERCGRFVKTATVEFNSTSVWDVREFAKMLEILADNRNLEKLSIQPTSCHIEWPERDGSRVVDQYFTMTEAIIKNCRKLKHLSLGCSEDLMANADYLLSELAIHHSNSLETLHLSTVKEDPESYGLLDLPVDMFQSFPHLTVLGIDYDYLTNSLLEIFVTKKTAQLEKLVIHVHGIEPDHEKIRNETWQCLVRYSPKLEVTLNLIHSVDGVTCLLDILRPSMPLAHFRSFFCSHINMAAIDFMAGHNSATLKSVHIVDGIMNMQPNIYESASDEDSFVMLAWKCPNLQHFTLLGYDVTDDDVVAIVRLRGSQLKTFVVPHCCISSLDEEDGSIWQSFGNVDQAFYDEVSKNLGRSWRPVEDHKLHPAIKHMHADAETAYLNILLRDQAY